MKKLLLGLLSLIVVLGIGVFVFQEPLQEAMIENATADMFVSEDHDDFAPGLAVGDTFPPLVTIAKGAPVTDVSQFAGDKGFIFIANRSVDW